MEPNVVIFDKPYSLEKQAEGMAVAWAVTNGVCNACRYLPQCERDDDFVFPGDAACTAKKKEILYDLTHLRDLIQAEQEGRLVVLPSAIGSGVFTIEESYFDCENCEHGAQAKYDPKINRRCCGLDNGEHCPYYIEGHIVKGFTIGAGDADKPTISAPGEWGYEGLETFTGIDGKWYSTREAAEAALKGGGEDA